MIEKPSGVFKVFSLIFVYLTALLLLTACQPNEFFEEENTVVKIEVIDANTKEQIAMITDQPFIDSLIEELETAQTSSTANLDMVGPDYRLLFLDEEDQLVQEIGYYIEEKNFGVIGRYHLDGEHIAVTIELPIRDE